MLAEETAAGLLRDHARAGAEAEAEQLRTAIASRAVIDQALGIVMHMLDCDADRAFGALRTLSQHTNRKLSVVAARIVRVKGRGSTRELRRLLGEGGRACKASRARGGPGGHALSGGGAPVGQEAGAEAVLQEAGRVDPEHDVRLQAGFVVEQPAYDVVAHHLFVDRVGLDVFGVEELGGGPGPGAFHREGEAGPTRATR